ncbi:hypothetical protein [Leptothermofonsia sp. ETS-13]|uniref:hypothetical protein n=1 Tax=Leptothermofonsia sp. ETS-13 TaxID=3035696 RepID=UPI003B9F3AE8
MVVDGKVVLVSDLKLFRLLVWVGKGEEMEAITSLSNESFALGCLVNGWSVSLMPATLAELEPKTVNE